jgi:hypothetical protein
MGFDYTCDDFARESLKHRLPSTLPPAAPPAPGYRPSAESIEALKARLHDSSDVRFQTSALAGALRALPEVPDPAVAGAAVALDGYLRHAVRDRVPAGRTEDQVVEALRPRFIPALTAAGSIGIQTHSGRSFDVEVEAGLAALAQSVGAAPAPAAPSDPGAEAFAYWNSQMQKQSQWRQEHPDYIARGLELPRADRLKA